MSVDLAKIKVGDEVLVRCIVTSLHADRLGLCTADSDEVRLWARVTAIVSHTPKALEVGDRVRSKDWAATFSIVCVDEGWAWLRDDEYTRIQLPLSDLERVS